MAAQHIGNRSICADVLGARQTLFQQAKQLGARLALLDTIARQWAGQCASAYDGQHDADRTWQPDTPIDQEQQSLQRMPVGVDYVPAFWKIR